MKKNYLLGLAFMALTWTSCTQDDCLNFVGDENAVFTGEMESVGSRTLLGEDNKISWLVGDELTIFQKNNLNRKYKVSTVTNGTATFGYVSYQTPDGGTSQLNSTNYYAIYPYSEANAIAADGTISAPVPAGYTYVDRSSFISSALMASTATSKNFSFKNVQGYLRLRLCAEIPQDYTANVESVTLTSTNKNLNGTAKITWNGNIPVVSIEGEEDENKALTVTLDTPQTLPSEASGDYIELYVPVCPMEFQAGEIALTINFAGGNDTYTKSNTGTLTILRGEVKGMKLVVRDDETMSGVIEEEVIINVETNEELAEINGKGGIAYLKGELESSEPISFTGALQAKGELTFDMNNNILTSGTPNDYGFIARGSDANVNLNNINFESKGGGVSASDGAKVTFNSGKVAINTKSTSGRYNFYAVGAGSQIIINGGEFSFEATKNIRRAYIYANPGTTVYVNGGTFGKASTRSGYSDGIMGEGTVIISGGTFGFNPSRWVADGYEAIQKNDKWYVVPEGVTFDTVASANNSNDLKDAVGTANTLVKLEAGEYTFPAGSIKEGVTIVCEPGTVFTGSSSLNIKGATVVGAEFSNPSGSAVSSTINGTFKKCKFTGNNGLRMTYAGETVVFEDCEFSGATYGVHFDGGANDVIFRNCILSGFNALGAALTMATFENCTFKGNGISGYNGINLWGNATMKNCEFTFDGSTVNEWVDCIGADKAYTFVNCTVNGSAFNSSNFAQFGEKIFSRNHVKVTIDGVECQF